MKENTLRKLKVLKAKHSNQFDKMMSYLMAKKILRVTNEAVQHESQKHILVCKELLKCNKNLSKITIYQRICDGTLMEYLQIAKLFKNNMNIIENMYRK